VRHLLRWWRLDHVAHLAEVVAGELVLAGTPASGYAVGDVGYQALVGVGWVTLWVELQPGQLLVETWDRDASPPRITCPGDSGAPGLYFDPMLADRWNYYTPSTGGKITWCELRIPPAGERPLPHRRPTAIVRRSAMTTFDSVLLRRVRDRLVDY